MIPYTGEFVQIFLSVLKSGGRGKGKDQKTQEETGK